jgi:uncharacterized protein with HEPN domain
MENNIHKYLLDINEAIDRLEIYFLNCPDFKEYELNSMLQDATERNLEIIGEAVNKILVIDPEIGISDSRRIVNTRNKLIHGYDSIDNAEVYVIVKKYIPILKLEIRTLMHNIGNV